MIKKIAEYSKKYRHPNLEPICESEIYSLDVDWKADKQWPFSDNYGVYAILQQDEVLYIGKASEGKLGYRLSAHITKDNNGNPQLDPNKWKEEPTNIMTFKVPKDSPFEASSLEEFLIQELKPPLNKIGK